MTRPAVPPRRSPRRRATRSARIELRVDLQAMPGQPPRPRFGVRAARFFDGLRERLWFWPALMGILAASAAEALVRLDRTLDDRDAQPSWVFSGTADAARSVLSTIASATMTVLGVTLSITLAVLALTGQGYSPRTIRRFIRDRQVQAVIGSFVGTFVFALTALRLVRVDNVPGITVTVAVLLAVGSLGLLIAFFHHMATEIQVESLIEAVWAETRLSIERTLPGRSPGEDAGPPPGPAARQARASSSGRVRTIDDDELVRLARDAGVSIVILVAPGDFVAEGEVVAHLHGPASGDHARRTSEALDVGPRRTLTQDVAFGIDQLTDIALRALSPGINDPTTAEDAILRSADLLRRLADRRLGIAVIQDGRLQVLRSRPTWDDLVGGAFDRIAAGVEAQGDGGTALVLIDALARVIAATDDPERVEALRDRVRRVRDGARRSLPEPSVLARVEHAASSLAEQRLGDSSHREPGSAA